MTILNNNYHCCVICRHLFAAYSCAVGQLLHGNIHCGQYPVLYGTRCTFTCLSGYTLQGPAIQTCGHYGTHTGLSAVACKGGCRYSFGCQLFKCKEKNHNHGFIER